MGFSFGIGSNNRLLFEGSLTPDGIYSIHTIGNLNLTMLFLPTLPYRFLRNKVDSCIMENVTQHIRQIKYDIQPGQDNRNLPVG